MKALRIIIPLIIAALLVFLTEFEHLTGVPLILAWVVGFLLAMGLTAYIEVKIRMQAMHDEDVKNDEK
ncbi:AbrB protein [Pediococcus argentinicus]|uniref:AbrB protein n=1 Tax=Pediococcus argentinicus TaxID=480391 RepID=UPI00338ED24C